MRLRASDALLIVHVQRDFCSGGALSITGADEIIPTINDLIKQAIEAKALVIASRGIRRIIRVFTRSGGSGPRIACKEATAPNFTPHCDCLAMRS
jgi:nicotinamidase/pyrazinamidase